jgi:hypothetical protein
MKRSIVAAVLCVAFAITARSQISLSPLTTFGGGDGWLAPDEGGYQYLGAFDSFANLERGIAYSPVSNHLYLVSRRNPTGTNGNNVRILNATTGEDIGALDTSNVVPAGSGGGTFAINMIAVGDDGAIYAANLHTNLSASVPFRVYKWETETSPALNIFTDPVLSGARLGDSFDAFGSGANTRLVAGFAGGSTSPAGSNGFTIINPATATFTNVAPPLGNAAGQTPVGEYRLGITFIDADTILGTQGTGSAGAAFRLTDVVGATGTVAASITPISAAERALDYAVVGGIPLLATLETGGGTTANTVRIYDFSNPQSPLLLTSGDATDPLTTANPNANAVGQIKFGAITGNTAIVYALNTNNGIQAFTLTIPEPSAGLTLAIGGGLLAGLRRRSRARRV